MLLQVGSASFSDRFDLLILEQRVGRKHPSLQKVTVRFVEALQRRLLFVAILFAHNGLRSVPSLRYSGWNSSASLRVFFCSRSLRQMAFSFSSPDSSRVFGVSAPT